jgi:hypothetical protein
MVSFTPRSLYHRESVPGTHCIGGSVDPKAGLDYVEKRKSCIYRESNSDLSVVQSVDSRYPGSVTGINLMLNNTLFRSIVLCYKNLSKSSHALWCFCVVEFTWNMALLLLLLLLVLLVLPQPPPFQSQKSKTMQSESHWKFRNTRILTEPWMPTFYFKT